jgi:Xaa-Pro aminopeptidase
MKLELKLPQPLQEIVDAEYPRYSQKELDRRRTLMAKAMAEAGVDHLVSYGFFFRGGPVYWLSDWLPTYEAVLVFTPGRKDTLLVQFYNHLPQAQQLMPHLDVRWGGPATLPTLVAELQARGAKPNRVGFAGGLPVAFYKALGAKFGEVADLNRAYGAFRLVKSLEEVQWYKIAARLSDLPIEALLRDMRPGMDERDLGAIVEGAYLPWRGQNIIHFFGTTSMHKPEVFVPRQHTTARKIAKGDVVFTEITASFYEHWGQVLRTFSLGEPLTPLYRKLHDTAEAAYDAILAAIRPGRHVRELTVGAKLIEDAGLTFYDDIVHGFGGGYLQPILGSPTRGEEPVPDMTLEVGMMMVIQPNVVTKDLKAGVQTGELVVVTESGAESLHTAPRGPLYVPA